MTNIHRVGFAPNVIRMSSVLAAMYLASVSGCSSDDPNGSNQSATPSGSSGSSGSSGGNNPEAGATSDAARPLDGGRAPDGTTLPDGNTVQDGGFVAPGMPRVFFSDLESAPNTGGQDGKGAFVTIYGAGFGSSRGSATVTVGGGAVDNYPLWTDTKITVQLGALATTGDIVVHSTNGNSNGVPFTVRNGRIMFVSPNGNGDGNLASPMSPSNAYSSIQAGDTYYLRAGDYCGHYGGMDGRRNFAFGKAQSGTPGNPVAFVGYPAETAKLVTPLSQSCGAQKDDDSGCNISTRSNSQDDTDLANHMTFANLTMLGGAFNISSGGFWQNENSGATNGRIIGNVLSAMYCTACNTMTGLLSIEGSGWRVLGNELKDTAGVPSINNNHGIYVNTGSDDVEIGWNYVHDLHVGHVIQVHTDIRYTYHDIRIHDNVLTATNHDDTRGISVLDMIDYDPNTGAGSYGKIYNNILYNVGQDFSGIAVAGGYWKIYNNTFYHVKSKDGIIWVERTRSGQIPKAEIFNNIFYSEGLRSDLGRNPPYVSYSNNSDATLSNNLYFNAGNGPSADVNAVNADPLFTNAAGGDFALQATSPAIDHGNAGVTGVVARDHAGVSRPQGGAVDIGAYER